MTGAPLKEKTAQAIKDNPECQRLRHRISNLQACVRVAILVGDQNAAQRIRKRLKAAQDELRWCEMFLEFGVWAKEAEDNAWKCRSFWR